MISQKRNFCSKSSVRTNNAREPGYVVLVNATVCFSCPVAMVTPSVSAKINLCGFIHFGTYTSCYPLCWQSERGENVGYSVLVSG